MVRISFPVLRHIKQGTILGERQVDTGKSMCCRDNFLKFTERTLFSFFLYLYYRYNLSTLTAYLIVLLACTCHIFNINCHPIGARSGREGDVDSWMEFYWERLIRIKVKVGKAKIELDSSLSKLSKILAKDSTCGRSQRPPKLRCGCEPAFYLSLHKIRNSKQEFSNGKLIHLRRRTIASRSCIVQ